MKRWHTIAGALLAWVLWVHGWNQNNFLDESWQTSNELIFSSEEKCNEFLIDTLIELGKQSEAENEGFLNPRDGSLWLELGTLKAQITAVCLPDGVDPQGGG
ncbi:MAG: hypothetical protein AB1515_05365, partial [Nitrospirota bacterium]